MVAAATIPTSVLPAPQGSTMMPERARWEPNMLYDTGQAVRVRGTYGTCRHLVCAGSQAERGLTPSGRGATAGGDNCRNGYRRLL